MSTPRTNEVLESERTAPKNLVRIETELSEMRQAMSQVAANLGNGSFATVNASHEWMVREVPEEVRLYCERLRRELDVMTKERDELKKDLGFSMDEANGLQGKLVTEREKVAKLRDAISPFAVIPDKAAQMELIGGRGGKELLKLCRCFDAQKALEETK